MKIPVIYENGKDGSVLPYMLEYLLREKKVIAFLRSTGWVQVDRDPTRKHQHEWEGPGKRRGDATINRLLQAQLLRARES